MTVSPVSLSPVYVGVDVNVTGDIGFVTRDLAMMPAHLAVVTGEFSDELGVILIEDDGSDLAALVLYSDQPVGLGWTFKAKS